MRKALTFIFLLFYFASFAQIIEPNVYYSLKTNGKAPIIKLYTDFPGAYLVINTIDTPRIYKLKYLGGSTNQGITEMQYSIITKDKHISNMLIRHVVGEAINEVLLFPDNNTDIDKAEKYILRQPQ